MSATIKICGLKDYDAIKMSIDLGAKYLGFVCDYPKSPRSVSPYKLVEILNNFSNLDVYKVAVLVNPDELTLNVPYPIAVFSSPVVFWDILFAPLVVL